MAGNLNVAKEAEQYLMKMQMKFQAYKRDWEKFPDEITEKAKAILIDGVTPEVSRSYGSGGYSYNVNLNLDQNKQAMEKYLSTVKTQLQEKADKFHLAIREMDGALDSFRKSGLEEAVMKKLVLHFVQWVDYTQTLKFQYEELKREIPMPEDLLAKRQKWKAVYPDAGSKTVKTVSVKTPDPGQSQAVQEKDTVMDAAQEIRNKRQEETDRIIIALKKEYNEEFCAIKERYDADLKKLNDEKSRVGKELSEKKRYQETLGFFQFGEKRATSNAIVALEQTKIQLQKSVMGLEDTFEQQKNALKESVERSWERQRKGIRKKFPTPKGISLYDIILLGMDPGGRYTPQEMAELPGVPAEVTPYWLNNKIISPLISQGKLRRVAENGRSFYMLP